MKNNWDKWLQETYDDLMCRYNIPPQKLPDSFERMAWQAWSAGRDSLEFADEFVRERRSEW